MNPALLNDIESRLRKDWTGFIERWQQAKEHWNDSRCRQFESEDLQPLPGILSQTSAAIAEFRDFAFAVSEELRDEESPRAEQPAMCKKVGAIRQEIASSLRSSR